MEYSDGCVNRARFIDSVCKNCNIYLLCEMHAHANRFNFQVQTQRRIHILAVAHILVTGKSLYWLRDENHPVSMLRPGFWILALRAQGTIRRNF